MMFFAARCKPITWLLIGVAVGLVGGLMIAGAWPDTPLHALATDRTGTFAMATGPVDEEVEAVFFLDFLTGDLTAVVLGRRGNVFTNSYHYNVLNDLGADPSKNPQFMMSTGQIPVRRGAGVGGLQPGLSAVYVAEVTSGTVAAYGVPWSNTTYARGVVVPLQRLVPLAATRFRKGAAGAGAAPGAGP